MPDEHARAIAVETLAGRPMPWGTCVDCFQGTPLQPWLCVHRNRYDHLLKTRRATAGEST
jgi:hypothetical protein